MKIALHFLSILNILFFINHLLLCFQTPPTTALHSSNETDRLALLAFKDGIYEDPLGVMTSWNESLHFCNWSGVLCSHRHQGRVIELNLVAQKLVGSIPPHIGNLSFLRYLNLSNNKFKGEIPQEIGHLFRLRLLNLSYNAFDGKIPSNLAFCSKLEVINFNHNNLTGKIPMELQNLTKSLRGMSAYGNPLTGRIPQWLGNASLLEELSLGGSNIDGSIPAELGRLTRLALLQLSENNLYGKVPLSIFNISSLYELAVANNQLQGKILEDVGFILPNLQRFYAGGNYFDGTIPSSLMNASLEGFDLGSNHLSGVVPSNLGSMKRLTRLSLGKNQLKTDQDEGLGFLTSLTNCSNLQHLDLSFNLLKGELPASIANLSTKLEFFSLAANQISGQIPKEIVNLVSLTLLIMHTANITGEIPSSISKLKKLSVLSLFENSISGMIPPSFENNTQLQVLYLDDNNLSGQIPPNLGNCSLLEYLFLRNNYLMGNIPEQLFDLSRVIELSMSRNSFTGRFPLGVGKMTELVELDVSLNKLSGGIPSTFENCLMLEQLWMNDNLFEGGIPPTFSNLKSLQFLDLSKNNLSGQIPKYFQSFTLLEYLNLSFNNFEGELPAGGIFRNSSAISVTGNQRLCGGIDQLGLPPCKIQGKKKKGKLHHLKLVISITASCSIFLIAVLLIIFSYRRKSKRKSSIMLPELEQFPKISYAELNQATNEFSSSNLIGQGSFGSVYKGILGRDGMLVAVKVLNLEQKGALKSFMAECEALRNIRHRNLIKIITICSSIDFRGTDFKAIVYEFMENGSLEGWLHPDEGQVGVRNLSFIQRLKISIEVASAIEYLHCNCQPSIVHGDLKPSNVLLDQDMVAHLGDFGLARFLSISQKQTSSSGIKGTVGYVAPEYGMSNKASKIGDVYSFGILLLEMITGKRPTDSMFKDGFTIHQFAKTALPERVMDILEPSLLLEAGDVENSRAMHRGRRVGILESLVSIARVGIICSMELPSERMEMTEVVAELCAIRDKFLGNRN